MESALKPKVPGEIRIVGLFGTTERYNGIAQEIRIREIFESKKEWRMIFVRAGRLFTPGIIKDADLLIIGREEGPDPADLLHEGGGVASGITKGNSPWTDANVDAIIDGVSKRGMGLIAMHASILCNNRRFLDFLDVAPLEPHGVEPMWYTHMNKTHPITQGMGKFAVLSDEQPLAIIKSGATATLFESTAVHEKRQGVSGWALEREKGRIAGLLPGSMAQAYQSPEYQTILWRAAHWAMHRDIPPYRKEEKRYYL
jgi:hypothetical protein